MFGPLQTKKKTTDHYRTMDHSGKPTSLSGLAKMTGGKRKSYRKSRKNRKSRKSRRQSRRR